MVWATLACAAIFCRAPLAAESLESAPEPPEYRAEYSDGPSEHSTAVVPAAATTMQPAPPVLPRPEVLPQTPSPRAAVSLFGALGISPASLSDSRSRMGIAPSAGVVLGLESISRATTDAGNLLGKSPSALGVEVQRRTPIVNDPRTRGSRVGSVAASGSYWVPARIDLDTMLSKLDSRSIENVLIIPGPYTVRHGPAFHTVDVELLRSPRYDDGLAWNGSTSLEYKTNGEQWYGRQALWGGDETWGVRAAYGHRTGTDYQSGAGLDIPSGYKSRDVDVALGVDLSPDEHLEFNLLRLDQTEVEFPGQLFDIDFLTTDGYEIEYTADAGAYFDRVNVEVWYNRTRFAGNAQNPGKRAQFPILDAIGYVGFTDVDSMSTGYRAFGTWGDDEGPQLSVGTDLRYLKQELNEIGSGGVGGNIFQNANSPIPRSHMPNPGLFADLTVPVDERSEITTGVRTDWAYANILADPSELDQLGNDFPIFQSSFAEIVGTDQVEQTFQLVTVFLTGSRALDDCWTLHAGAAYAERPPNLTELYAAEPFLFLLQNGQNNATGDPLLDPERRWQIDLGLKFDTGDVRAGINGFHAWVRDYITFENMRAGNDQVDLKYVNTDLATLAGFELYAEYDWTDGLTPFATLRYVEGRDHSRNGDFATVPAMGPGAPSFRAMGFSRGAASGIVGGPEEPLPSMPPLESRLGVRLHEPEPQPRWGLEFSARVVDDQDRIAASLLETPTAGFAVFDLRGYWQLTERLLVIAGVENLTDRNYREHLDYRTQSGLSMYQPGVNFYFGSELTY